MSPIGLNAMLFFSPSWPRRGVALQPFDDGHRARAPVALLAVYFAVQFLMPLRHLAYPGDAGFTEEGARYAWRVMLKEKAGFVVYHVTDERGRSYEAYPREYLTPIQQKMVTIEPDFIRQLAHHIRKDYEARGLGRVVVRAESYVSVNGEPSRPLIDPDYDLGRAEPRLGVEPWVPR